MIMHKYKEYYNAKPEIHNDNKETDPRIEYHRDVSGNKDKMDHTNIQKPNSPLEAENEKALHEETFHDENIETHDPELIEALDRISKIIKLRVYPSQTPDFSIYKKYQQDIKNDKDVEEHKKENGHSIQSPIGYSTPQGQVINQSAIRFINNLYDLNAHETDKILENKYQTTADANGYYNNEPEEKNNNSINNVIPYAISFAVKQIENKYTTVSPYVSHTERYHDNTEYNKYTPKLHDGNKIHDSKNKWHDKYLPYKSDHSQYEKEAYTDYFKPNLEDYHSKNSYSTSVPTGNKGFTYFEHAPFNFNGAKL